MSTHDSGCTPSIDACASAYGSGPSAATMASIVGVWPPPPHAPAHSATAITMSRRPTRGSYHGSLLDLASGSYSTEFRAPGVARPVALGAVLAPTSHPPGRIRSTLRPCHEEPEVS